MDALEVIDHTQTANGDGAKTLSEWTARRADIGLDTARSLVRTMRRTQDRRRLREALISGDATFDRVEAAARIESKEGADPLLLHLDVQGVHREAANRARVEEVDESRTFQDRYLVLQPTIDESWWKLWGGFDAVTGAIVDQALTAAADALPETESPRTAGWRRATALAQICVSDDALPTQITVFVDAAIAAPTDGAAGVQLAAGPGIGRTALEALLCDSVTEVTVIGSQAEPMRYGRRSRTIPGGLRRAILRRDGNRCVIDGCDSRHRLQIHHVVPWSKGGPTDPENLVTVCWYHHHIAIHQQQLDLCRHPVHGRYQLQHRVRPPPG
jgi:hypothetical protein